MTGRLLLVAALAACGGSARTQTATASSAPAAIREVPALRWAPAQPSYVIGGHTLRDAQRGFAEALETFGLVLGLDRAQLSAALHERIGLDPLSPDELAGIGVDLDGSLAVFSADLAPTFVVHLSAPAQTAAFFDKLRGKAHATSTMHDGVEVFAIAGGDLELAWAIDKDWLFLHAGPAGDAAWFSRRTESPAWLASWDWARARAKSPSLVGFVDAKALAAKLPRAAEACMQLVEPVSRIAIDIEGGASANLAFDIGPLAAALGFVMVPPPAGWSAASQGAPLAAQWNVDFSRAVAMVGPCAHTIGIDLDAFTKYGVRTARVMLQTFDPREPSGTGAVALDLTSKKYFADLLDDIPFRSRFEDKKQFGTLTGRHLSVPLVPDLDYVLTDSLALAAMGDGLLARVVGNGAPVATKTLVAIDVVPAGLTAKAWEDLLERAEVPRAGWVAGQLLRWRDLHFAATIDGGSVVVEASGNRR